MGDLPRDYGIQLTDLAFSFKGGPKVLQIDSFSVGAGQSVFLHGPSGSGKTTLLSIISGIQVPQTGTVMVLGRNLAELSNTARDTLRGSRIGYIFQGFNLIPYLSVADNIALPCRLHAERRARIKAATLDGEIMRLAQRLDIERLLAKPVTKLSLGQQQRVAIARAVIGSPELLIADEPTSSLDTDRRDQFLQLLMEVAEEAREHSEKTTLLFVSHDRTLAAHFDRVLSLGEINQCALEDTAAKR